MPLRPRTSSILSEINDHLLLSGSNGLRPELIKQRNITCVISATTEEPQCHIPGIEFVRVPIEDSPTANIDSYFDIVVSRVQANRRLGGKTLVHCVAGVSRSATLCIVYLMKSEQMTLREAYYHVKAVRPIVRPNSGFWKQMIDFEYRQFGSNSVAMVSSKWNEPIPDVYKEELRSGGYSPSLSLGSNVSIARRRPATFLGTVVNGDLMFPRL